MKRVFWLVAVALAGCSRAGSDSIVANGTLEIVEMDIAPLMTARVDRVLVQDGDSVRAGDTLVVLSQPTSAADIQQRAARVAESTAGLGEVERGARAPEIARAEAELQGLEAEAKRLSDDATRARRLYAAGAISQQQMEAAVTGSRGSAARRDAARQSVILLRQGATRERVEAARAEVAGAQANLSAGRASVDALTLLAPVNGVVMSRNVEPGETVTQGQSAVTLGDVKRPWVRVYVNALDVPNVKVGSPAHAVLDGLPGRSFNGRVVAINRKAEFTPRVALTEEERADMTFGVKVEFEDASGALRPGLPVTVTIPRSSPRT
ncbi:MAG: efflux RND transporter periplasmic adaptor subunit [Gemmatimonadaceae bacterium]|nr:efflux RND transporter periplasmic adaptor subunit [Gemmatimonadaceae bacterium]